MSRRYTVSVPASRYVDAEDCLAAAAADYADEHDLAGWDLSPRWDGGEDGERDAILLYVPMWAIDAEVAS